MEDGANKHNGSSTHTTDAFIFPLIIVPHPAWRRPSVRLAGSRLT